MATVTTGPVIGAAVSSRVPDPNIQAAAHADVPPLPAGLPLRLHGDLAWVGKQFEDENKYIYRLTPCDLDEISVAIAHFKGEEHCTVQPGYHIIKRRQC
jgi:hypothetical protein